jgi:hypothetical protein
MKTKLALFSTLAVLFLLIASGSVTAQTSGAARATPLGSAFTYQGRLSFTGTPASSAYDFQFYLFDASSGGSQVGAMIPVDDLVLTDGYFTVQLDFGAGAFNGQRRYLEVRVRPGNETVAFSVLDPRQELTAAPGALYALSAPWSGLTGIPAGFADGIDNDTTYTAGTGLTLSSGQFSLTATYRLPQACAANQIPKWNGSAWICAADETGAGGSFWSLTGNAGTNPTTNFLGTSDNQALELRVNSLRALRLEPGAYSTINVIAGYSGNTVTAGVYGATINGGGGSGTINLVTDGASTIGGGVFNTAGNNNADLNDASNATVGGGSGNIASGYSSTVGGGATNTASGYGASIGAGMNNTATGWMSSVGGGWMNNANSNGASVGGGTYNLAQAAYATISGGGPSDPNSAFTTDNRVFDDYGTIGGGGYNRAGSDDADTTTATYATIAGGYKNIASYWEATVGGGGENIASSWNATVSGGEMNTASGDKATVGGGVFNIASGGTAFVGGGGTNTASGRRSAISGGYFNLAQAAYATISGGGPLDEVSPETTNNRVYDDYGTISGGANNRAGNDDSNTTTAQFATVGGGRINQATNQAATVGGGWVNTASGNASTVPGGANNEATGAYSFAAGADGHATHDGSFVWSSATRTDSWGVQTFTVRAPGGVRFYTATGTTTGVQLPAGGGSFSSLSDRASKENFSPVNAQTLLAKVASLPVSTWNYKSQDQSILHIGPMAQDFYAAFGVGEDQKYISSIDADGVALAAIQGLYQQNQQQAAEIQSLKAQIADSKGGIYLAPTVYRVPITMWVVIALLAVSQVGMFVLLRRKAGRS